jgi:enoyl-CoA hydratase/carnithine racemase
LRLRHTLVVVFFGQQFFVVGFVVLVSCVLVFSVHIAFQISPVMYSPKLRSPLSRVLTSASLKRGCSISMPRLASTSASASAVLPKYVFTSSRTMSTQTLASPSDIDKKEEYHFDEVEINNMLQAEEDRLASYNGVQVINSTGVRAVEFCRPDTGNYLTTSVVQNLVKKIDDFEDNWVANAIFLGSQSLYFFSAGVHESDFLQTETEGRELDKSIQVCASRVLDFPNHLISLYGGFITGTPFGMLLGSHYRLGTPSLLLCLNEPCRGQLPLGGLALGFARHSTIAPVVLKYLAVSGATLHSNELYELGVLTHLTDHKPHRGMQYGDTILQHDTKATQPAHGEAAYLDDMIDDMDINVEMDIHSHEAWDQFLTVPVAVPEADAVEDTNIKIIFNDMEAMFSQGVSFEESVNMLVAQREQSQSSGQQVATWVDNALRHVVKCSPLALKCWFRLVDESQELADTYKGMLADPETHSAADCENFYKRSHADMLAKEVQINEVSCVIYKVMREREREGGTASIRTNAIYSELYFNLYC